MTDVQTPDSQALQTLVARAPASHPAFEAAKWKPGQSGNPSGKSHATEEYRRVRLLCRQRSIDATEEIIRLFQHSDDDRVRFMAAQWCYTQAWGQAPPYDPESEKPPSQLDLGKLSAEQRQQLRELLTKAVARPEMGEGMGSVVDAAPNDSNSK